MIVELHRIQQTKARRHGGVEEAYLDVAETLTQIHSGWMCSKMQAQRAR